LAEHYQDRVAVRERLQQLAEHECTVLEQLPPLPRIHA
jgi:tRNA isopentenyl-2-thiomethyl-A-37 hydroxylase MiaE